jgi:hypothetical protein
MVFEPMETRLKPISIVFFGFDLGGNNGKENTIIYKTADTGRKG